MEKGSTVPAPWLVLPSRQMLVVLASMAMMTMNLVTQVDSQSHVEDIRSSFTTENLELSKSGDVSMLSEEGHLSAKNEDAGTTPLTVLGTSLLVVEGPLSQFSQEESQVTSSAVEMTAQGFVTVTLSESQVYSVSFTSSSSGDGLQLLSTYFTLDLQSKTTVQGRTFSAENGASFSTFETGYVQYSSVTNDLSDSSVIIPGLISVIHLESSTYSSLPGTSSEVIVATFSKDVPSIADSGITSSKISAFSPTLSGTESSQTEYSSSGSYQTFVSRSYHISSSFYVTLQASYDGTDVLGALGSFVSTTSRVREVFETKNNIFSLESTQQLWTYSADSLLYGKPTQLFISASLTSITEGYVNLDSSMLPLSYQTKLNENTGNDDTGGLEASNTQSLFLSSTRSNSVEELMSKHLSALLTNIKSVLEPSVLSSVSTDRLSSFQTVTDIVGVSGSTENLEPTIIDSGSVAENMGLTMIDSRSFTDIVGSTMIDSRSFTDIVGSTVVDSRLFTDNVGWTIIGSSSITMPMLSDLEPSSSLFGEIPTSVLFSSWLQSRSQKYSDIQTEDHSFQNNASKDNSEGSVSRESSTSYGPSWLSFQLTYSIQSLDSTQTTSSFQFWDSTKFSSSIQFLDFTQSLPSVQLLDSTQSLPSVQLLDSTQSLSSIQLLDSNQMTPSLQFWFSIQSSSSIQLMDSFKSLLSNMPMDSTHFVYPGQSTDATYSMGNIQATFFTESSTPSSSSVLYAFSVSLPQQSHLAETLDITIEKTTARFSSDVNEGQTFGGLISNASKQQTFEGFTPILGMASDFSVEQTMKVFMSDISAEQPIRGFTSDLSTKQIRSLPSDLSTQQTLKSLSSDLSAEHTLISLASSPGTKQTINMSNLSPVQTMWNTLIPTYFPQFTLDTSPTSWRNEFRSITTSLEFNYVQTSSLQDSIQVTISIASAQTSSPQENIQSITSSASETSSQTSLAPADTIHMMNVSDIYLDVSDMSTVSTMKSMTMWVSTTNERLPDHQNEGSTFVMQDSTISFVLLDSSMDSAISSKALNSRMDSSSSFMTLDTNMDLTSSFISLDSSKNSTTSFILMDSNMDSISSFMSLDSRMDSTIYLMSLNSRIDSSISFISPLDSRIDSTSSIIFLDSNMDSTSSFMSLDYRMDSATSLSSLDSIMDSAIFSISLDSRIYSTISFMPLDSIMDSTSSFMLMDSSMDVIMNFDTMELITSSRLLPQWTTVWPTLHQPSFSTAVFTSDDFRSKDSSLDDVATSNVQQATSVSDISSVKPSSGNLDLSSFGGSDSLQTSATTSYETATTGDIFSSTGGFESFQTSSMNTHATAIMSDISSSFSGSESLQTSTATTYETAMLGSISSSFGGSDILQTSTTTTHETVITVDASSFSESESLQTSATISYETAITSDGTTFLPSLLSSTYQIEPSFTEQFSSHAPATTSFPPQTESMSSLPVIVDTNDRTFLPSQTTHFQPSTSDFQLYSTFINSMSDKGSFMAETVIHILNTDAVINATTSADFTPFTAQVDRTPNISQLPASSLNSIISSPVSDTLMFALTPVNMTDTLQLSSIAEDSKFELSSSEAASMFSDWSQIFQNSELLLIKSDLFSISSLDQISFTATSPFSGSENVERPSSAFEDVSQTFAIPPSVTLLNETQTILTFAIQPSVTLLTETPSSVLVDVSQTYMIQSSATVLAESPSSLPTSFDSPSLQGTFAELFASAISMTAQTIPATALYESPFVTSSIFVTVAISETPFATSVKSESQLFWNTNIEPPISMNMIPESSVSMSIMPESSVSMNTIPESAVSMSTIPESSLSMSTIPESPVFNSMTPEPTFMTTITSEPEHVTGTISKITFVTSMILESLSESSPVISSTQESSILTNIISESSFVMNTISESPLVINTVPDTSFLTSIIPESSFVPTVSESSSVSNTMSESSSVMNTVLESSFIPESSFLTSVPESSTVMNTISQSSLVTTVLESSFASITVPSFVMSSMPESSFVTGTISESSFITGTISESSFVAGTVSESSPVTNTLSESSLVITTISESSIATNTLPESSFATNTLPESSFATNTISESSPVMTTTSELPPVTSTAYPPTPGPNVTQPAVDGGRNNTANWVVTNFRILPSVDVSSAQFRTSLERGLANSYYLSRLRREEIRNGTYVPLNRRRRKRFTSADMDNSTRVDMISTARSGTSTSVDAVYVVEENGKILKATEAVDQLKLLSDQEVAIQTGHVVGELAKPYVTPASSSDDDTTKWIIIGCVVGGVVLIIIIIVIIIICCCCCKRCSNGRDTYKVGATENAQNNAESRVAAMAFGSEKEDDVLKAEQGKLPSREGSRQSSVKAQGNKRNSSGSVGKKENARTLPNIGKQNLTPEGVKKKKKKKEEATEEDIHLVYESQMASLNTSSNIPMTYSKAGATLNSQPTVEEESDLLENAEEERKKNKRRARAKKINEMEDESPSKFMNDLASEYKQVQQEINKILESPSHEARSSKKSNRNRAKKKHKDTTDEDEDVTESTEDKMESLEKAREKMHKLLDDAFSVLSQSKSSMTSKVEPTREDNSDTQNKTRHDQVLHSDVSTQSDRQHTPMQVIRSRRPHEHESLVTWSPYRGYDESALIVLPNTQTNLSHVPPKQEPTQAVYEESIPYSQHSNYYTTEPAEPIIIKTKNQQQIRPRKERRSKTDSQKHTQHQGRHEHPSLNSNSKTNQLNFQNPAYDSTLPSYSTTEYPESYFGLSSYQEIPTSTVISKPRNENKMNGRLVGRHESDADDASNSSRSMDDHPNQKERTHTAPRKHGNRNIDDLDIIKDSLRPGESPQMLINSLREELETLSSKRMAKDGVRGSSTNNSRDRSRARRDNMHDVLELKAVSGGGSSDA